MLMLMITPETIKKIRADLGLTAEALAKRLGVTTNTVFNWQAGRRHPKYDMQIELNKLADEAKNAQVA